MSKELKLYVIECDSALTDLKYADLVDDIGKKLLDNGWKEVTTNKYPMLMFSATSTVVNVEGHRDFAAHANMGFRPSVEEAKKIEVSIGSRRESKRIDERVKEAIKITDKMLIGQESYPTIEEYPNRPSQLVMGEYLKYHAKFALEYGTLFRNCSIITYLMTTNNFKYSEYVEMCNSQQIVALPEQKAWWKAVVMCSPQKLQVIVAETQKPLIGDRIWEEMESDESINIYRGLCEADTEEDAILQSTSWAKEFFML